MNNIWSNLNNFQLGKYAEYYIKMEFTLHGFYVYNSEIDDKGIDFVTQYENASFFTLQSKSVRGYKNVYMEKEKFRMVYNNYLALAIFNDVSLPQLYLIPAYHWLSLNPLLADRNYKDLQSKPEWGIRLSNKNQILLDKYKFDTIIEIIKDLSMVIRIGSDFFELVAANKFTWYGTDNDITTRLNSITSSLFKMDDVFGPDKGFPNLIIESYLKKAFTFERIWYKNQDEDLDLDTNIVY